MTANALFGPSVLGSDVEAAAITTLKTWFPTYLAELERRTGRNQGVLQPPRSYITVPSFSQLQGSQQPSVIVVSPGTLDKPERLGDGTYRAWWRIEIAIVVTAKDRASANELAKLYTAATRMILLQKSSLGGFSQDTEWDGDQYTEAPPDFAQIGSVGAAAFNVLVLGVVTDLGGPATPDLDPGIPGEVATVQTTVERISA